MSIVLIVVLIVTPILGGLCFCMGFCAGSAYVSRQHLDKYEKAPPSQPQEQKVHPPPIQPPKIARLVRPQERPQERRERVPMREQPTLPIAPMKKKKKLRPVNPIPYDNQYPEEMNNGQIYEQV